MSVQYVRPKQSEKGFQAEVLRLAALFGWRAYHTWDSRRSASGFPDLILVRNGRVIAAEFKTNHGQGDARSAGMAQCARCKRAHRDVRLEAQHAGADRGGGAVISSSEIRVRVSADDIRRAVESDDGEAEFICPVAQALMALGFIGVEIYASDDIWIGNERFAVIDESPGGERLWRLIADFDECLQPEPAEFVLRRVS